MSPRTRHAIRAPSPSPRTGVPLATLLILLATSAGCAPADENGPLLGTVERTLIEIVAPVSETIRVLHVERGQRVEEGALLLEFDTRLAEADLAAVEAELEGARTADTLTRREHERLLAMGADRLVSEQQIEDAELAADEAAARLRAATARLAAARKRLEDLRPTAPVAGVVDQLPFDPGERVPAGAVVAVLLDEAAPWVRVWLPALRLTDTGPGTKARVRIDGLAEPLVGRVLDVAHEPEFTPHFALTGDERVHLVYETRVQLIDAPAELRPGLPAEVELQPGP